MTFLQYLNLKPWRAIIYNWMTTKLEGTKLKGMEIGWREKIMLLRQIKSFNLKSQTLKPILRTT